MIVKRSYRELVEDHLDFLAQTLQTLQGHEHNDPVIHQLEVEIVLMMEQTDEYIYELQMH